MTNVIKLNSIDSTNNYAKEMIAQDGLGQSRVPSRFAVVADVQSAGRGRYGKEFYSPAGCGVYLSYAFECNYALEDMQKITVVAASLVHQILRTHCDKDLNIKWVNDLLIGTRKVAGILTERVDKPGTDFYYIIIGVGVNVLPTNVPPELSDIITTVCEGTDPALIKTITNELIDAFDVGFETADTFTSLVDYYRQHCINLPSDFADKLLDQ